MKAMHKALWFSGLAALLFLVFQTENSKVFRVLEKDNQQTELSSAKGHPQVFLQPQAAHQFVSLHKSNGFSPLNWTVHFYGLAKAISLPNRSSIFSFQDIDRCETVSRHLFPYHFFW